MLLCRSCVPVDCHCLQIAQRHLLRGKDAATGKVLSAALYQKIVDRFHEVFGKEGAGWAFMTLFVAELSDFRRPPTTQALPTPAPPAPSCPLALLPHITKAGKPRLAPLTAAAARCEQAARPAGGARRARHAHGGERRLATLPLPSEPWHAWRPCPKRAAKHERPRPTGDAAAEESEAAPRRRAVRPDGPRGTRVLHADCHPALKPPHGGPRGIALLRRWEMLVGFGRRHGCVRRRKCMACGHSMRWKEPRFVRCNPALGALKNSLLAVALCSRAGGPRATSSPSDAPPGHFALWIARARTL